MLGRIHVHFRLEMRGLFPQLDLVYPVDI